MQSLSIARLRLRRSACKIDDPLLYDLTINTGNCSDQQVVEILIAAIRKMKRS